MILLSKFDVNEMEHMKVSCQKGVRINILIGPGSLLDLLLR